MRPKKIFWSAAVILLSASLASCSGVANAGPPLDVSSIFTLVAGTMLAQYNDQMTQTAQPASSISTDASSPGSTFTPLPTFPVVPGITLVAPTSISIATILDTPVGTTAVGCNDAVLAAETIPDNTLLNEGKIFSKVWQLENTGTCAWGIGYQFAFISGDQMGGTNIVIKKTDTFTAAGHSNTFIVSLIAPTTIGEYTGYWGMEDASGIPFGASVHVLIDTQVAKATQTFTPSPSATPVVSSTATGVPGPSNTTIPINTIAPTPSNTPAPIDTVAPTNTLPPASTPTP